MRRRERLPSTMEATWAISGTRYAERLRRLQIRYGTSHGALGQAVINSTTCAQLRLQVLPVHVTGHCTECQSLKSYQSSPGDRRSRDTEGRVCLQWLLEASILVAGELGHCGLDVIRHDVAESRTIPDITLQPTCSTQYLET